MMFLFCRLRVLAALSDARALLAAAAGEHAGEDEIETQPGQGTKTPRGRRARRFSLAGRKLWYLLCWANEQPQGTCPSILSRPNSLDSRSRVEVFGSCRPRTDRNARSRLCSRLQSPGRLNLVWTPLLDSAKLC
jgi:hypothetical protein